MVTVEHVQIPKVPVILRKATLFTLLELHAHL